MHYIDTAFQQLEFAWELCAHVQKGNVNLEKLDTSITFQEGKSVLVLADRVFQDMSKLMIACQSNLSITFGAAAITLNKCREEAGLELPNPIVSEVDQFIALAYQIRNAFAHDISEPRWNITKLRYARHYSFGGIEVDLSSVADKAFEYSDIGGPETLLHMKRYASKYVW